jgi:tetratricopeptide (TPR) repeat protein
MRMAFLAIIWLGISVNSGKRLLLPPQTQSREDEPYAAERAVDKAAAEADKYFAQGSYDQAVPLYEKFLRISDVSGAERGVKHWHGVRLLRLAESYGRLGNDEKVDGILRRFLDVHKTDASSLRTFKLRLEQARELTVMANEDYVAGKYLVPCTLYSQALSVYRAELGLQHPHVATCLENLAAVSTLDGRHINAIWFYRQALAIREKTQGATHADLAPVLDRYAAVLRKAGRDDEADKAEDRATRIRRR